ncbi:MAG TPA: ABC transporter ATP-binding protein [Thermoanaerobaculia bacterium]|nr:ABC transporter ATP-binding protein [Thermoanaerobaculia bacterium]
MSSEASVAIEGVTKRFGEVVAVDAVTLDIRRGEFFSLLGPSGCGKTTLLRMIGGFEQPDAGTIRIDGADVTGVPPHRRPVNMVFQHYALFPHLTVGENVAFGFRYRRFPAAEHACRVGEALALVRLEGFERRLPSQLSGGQRQRVALARALALEPRVLLLDEPLGALDQKLRQEMQGELKGLQRTLGITFVFVTHDQEEALTMSDRVAVMNAGRVEQVDAAPRLFERPRTEFVARFLGAGNFFAGERPDGSPLRFVVRPEKLMLRREAGEGDASCLAVTIEERTYHGVSTTWTVRDETGERFTVYEQNDERNAARGELAAGDRALLCWHPRHAVPLD